MAGKFLVELNGKESTKFGKMPQHAAHVAGNNLHLLYPVKHYASFYFSKLILKSLYSCVVEFLSGSRSVFTAYAVLISYHLCSHRSVNVNIQVTTTGKGSAISDLALYGNAIIEIH